MKPKISYKFISARNLCKKFCFSVSVIWLCTNKSNGRSQFWRSVENYSWPFTSVSSSILRWGVSDFFQWNMVCWKFVCECGCTPLPVLATDEFQKIRWELAVYFIFELHLEWHLNWWFFLHYYGCYWLPVSWMPHFSAVCRLQFNATKAVSLYSSSLLLNFVNYLRYTMQSFLGCKISSCLGSCKPWQTHSCSIFITFAWNPDFLYVSTCSSGFAGWILRILSATEATNFHKLQSVYYKGNWWYRATALWMLMF